MENITLVNIGKYHQFIVEAVVVSTTQNKSDKLNKKLFHDAQGHPKATFILRSTM